MADPNPSPSFDTAPRLQSASADPASAYAPISWSAAAALTIAGLFAITLIIMGYMALRAKQPLVAPWLFVLPIVGMAVAFVARRQIAASEGTRTGTQYANAGWWLCVVGGLVYAAYLGGLEYTVRADAKREFEAWTARLTGIDPEAADQPALFAAFYGTLQPNQRVGLNADAWSEDKDPDGRNRRAIRDRFGAPLVKFRQHPVVQQKARYGDDCQFVTEGMKDWKYQGGKIECTLAVTMKTPEGDYPLIVPMEAVVERGEKSWQVKIAEGGAAGPPLRTPLGFLVEGWLKRSAQLAAAEFLLTAKPNSDRKIAVESGFLAATGGVAAIPPTAQYDEFTTKGPLVTALGGASHPSDKLQAFREAWARDAGYRFAVIGILGEPLAENPDAPAIELLADRVRVRMPCQYRPHGAERSGAGVRMRLVMECTDPAVLAAITTAKASAATDPRRDDLGKDDPLRARQLIPLTSWNMVRFESDLVKLTPPQQQQPGGGGMGG